MPDMSPRLAHGSASSPFDRESVLPFSSTRAMAFRPSSRFRKKLSLRVIATGLAIAGSVVATGQAPAPGPPDPIPYQKDLGSEKKLWGYADATGRLIVPAQFDLARRFGPEGLAVIKRGPRWGMINREGREVIPAKFTYQVDAHDGRIGVCVDDGREIPGLSVLGPNPGQRTAVEGQ